MVLRAHIMAQFSSGSPPEHRFWLSKVNHRMRQRCLFLPRISIAWSACIMLCRWMLAYSPPVSHLWCSELILWLNSAVVHMCCTRSCSTSPLNWNWPFSKMTRPPIRMVHPFKRVPASPGAISGALSSSSECALACVDAKYEIGNRFNKWFRAVFILRLCRNEMRRSRMKRAWSWFTTIESKVWRVPEIRSNDRLRTSPRLPLIDRRLDRCRSPRTVQKHKDSGKAMRTKSNYI